MRLYSKVIATFLASIFILLSWVATIAALPYIWLSETDHWQVKQFITEPLKLLKELWKE